MALFIWNVVSVIFIFGLASVGRLTAGLEATVGILDISDIIQSFDHDKVSSISQLI